MSTAIRAVRDDDAWDLIGLVAGCWSEYPGCILDVHGEVPELLALASHYAKLDGRAWVAETEGRLEGLVALAPSGGGVALQKLYVARRARGVGLGTRLVDLVETEARRRSAAFIELWSDTRFDAAHRLYERLGFLRLPQTRELHDLSGSIEYGFVKRLAGSGAAGAGEAAGAKPEAATATAP